MLILYISSLLKDLIYNCFVKLRRREFSDLDLIKQAAIIDIPENVRKEVVRGDVVLDEKLRKEMLKREEKNKKTWAPNLTFDLKFKFDLF